MTTYHGVPCSPEVAEFLAANDDEMNRSNLHRGMAFTPDPDGFVRDVVLDYVTTFAWNGCTARDVIAETGRDERWVKRSLKELVANGTLRVEEYPTRGPRASKGKRYRLNADNRAPIESYGDSPDRCRNDECGRKVTCPMLD